MNIIIVASTRRNAGKTSFIVGISEALSLKIGYIKPFGDRLLYKKKRLWDYDALEITKIFSLIENPEDMSIGFDHSKIRYVYDQETIKRKLIDTINEIKKDKDVIFVEGGQDIFSGSSINLDAITLKELLGAKLYIIVSGNDDLVVDDITFLKKYILKNNIEISGIIVNKIANIDEFKSNHYEKITKMGINLVGILPFKESLTYFTMDYLSKRLFAKIIAGEGGLNKIVRNIFVGAMSANAALMNPLFQKEDKLIITSGDRSDMILASLESNTSGIILTNNIIPPSQIISKATEKNIPLLLVSIDTYQVAKQIDNLEPLITSEDTYKREILKELISSNVNLVEFSNFK